MDKTIKSALIVLLLSGCANQPTNQCVKYENISSEKQIKIVSELEQCGLNCTNTIDYLTEKIMPLLTRISVCK